VNKVHMFEVPQRPSLGTGNANCMSHVYMDNPCPGYTRTNIPAYILVKSCVLID